MKRLETRLEGPILLCPECRADSRGWFLETYRLQTLRGLGVCEQFVQDNHSRSRRGVIRGMHFQVGEGQAKLVRCARGAIVDVVVDIRRGSPTFGEWEAFDLDDERHLQLYCPVGFAHGFCVTSESADVVYKCSSYYRAEVERTIAWNDPATAISWPQGIELIVSERDANAPLLKELAAELPFEYRQR